VADAGELLGLVEAVSIAAPTDVHLKLARPFLERGIHVLVEKPIAATVAEAEEMVALAQASGATLAVGHTERFNPGFIAARPHIQAAKFIEVHRLSAFPERSLDIDVIFDLMVHDLDIILSVDGTDVTWVDAVGVPVLSDRIDICSARLKFESGATANITASRISHERVRKARFFQPHLLVSVDFGAQSAATWGVEAKAGARASIQGGPIEVVKDEPLRAELADFVAAVRGGRAPVVTGRDGLRALALASRISQACRT
jgi:predicted dehydrogenase